jgi:hypothetical protein
MICATVVPLHPVHKSPSLRVAENWLFAASPIEEVGDRADRDGLDPVFLSVCVSLCRRILPLSRTGGRGADRAAGADLQIFGSDSS